jgi:hypothetical protein
LQNASKKSRHNLVNIRDETGELPGLKSRECLKEKFNELENNGKIKNMTSFQTGIN